MTKWQKQIDGELGTERRAVAEILVNCKEVIVVGIVGGIVVLRTWNRGMMPIKFTTNTCLDCTTLIK